ncbi:MAG: hypothetical protein OHK0056_08140 [Bacteriovoracaceae bacterium]
MKPGHPLKNLNSEYDVLIVGGGIVGAGLFRDLALHGLRCLLIDAKDFSSQTSAKSSKMLHGGIRYLENFDLKLVWEALHEKNLWLKLTPHLCYEAPFTTPVYKDSLRPLWMIRAGLMMYDALSSYQNTPHKIKNIQETISNFPTLRQYGLTGSGIYYDAIMDDVKLTLEVIYDALHEKGNTALNYVSLEDFKAGEFNNKARLRDQLTGDEIIISTPVTVFATGPFTDRLLSKFTDFNWTPKLLPSKGSHLWLKKDALDIKTPLLLTPNDGRVLFVIPQKERILVGTTEVPLDKDQFFDLEASQKEIEYIMSCLHEYFPLQPVNKESILASFSGIRPLVKEDSNSSLGKTAREHKVFQPSKNSYAILGGKYTTFRSMVLDLASDILHRFGLVHSNQTTIRPLRQKSLQLPFAPIEVTNELIEQISAHELVRTKEDLYLRRLDQIN